MQQEPPPNQPGTPQGPPPSLPPGWPPPGVPSPPAPAGPASSQWTPLTALLGIATGFGAAMVLFVVAIAAYSAAGGKQDDPGFVVVMAIVQNIAFFGAAWYVASRGMPLRLTDFGLRRAGLARAVVVYLSIGIAYVALLAVYAEAVDLKEDTVPKDLGADKSTLAMIGFALIAVVVAPLFEELFFRGFLFRAFANGIGIVLGAIVPAIYFGILHWDFETTDRLLAVVPLTILGLLLAFAYHLSGTLYTSIAIHATNNALAVVAFAADEKSDLGIALAAGLWLAMIAVCVFGPLLTDRRGEVDAQSSAGPPPPGTEWAPQPAPPAPRWLPPQPGQAPPPGPGLVPMPPPPGGWAPPPGPMPHGPMPPPNASPPPAPHVGYAAPPPPLAPPPAPPPPTPQPPTFQDEEKPPAGETAPDE